jgi:hypothetical protein
MDTASKKKSFSRGESHSAEAQLWSINGAQGSISGKLDPINYAQGSISGAKYKQLLNSTFIAPKWPVLGRYSALIAQLIRRLLRQTKLILTFIAPNQTADWNLEQIMCARQLPGETTGSCWRDTPWAGHHSLSQLQNTLLTAAPASGR